MIACSYEIYISWNCVVCTSYKYISLLQHAFINMFYNIRVSFCPKFVTPIINLKMSIFEYIIFLEPYNSYIGYLKALFSSPGHRPCELLSWVSVRRPSVRPSVSFSHLNLLLWNRWTEISQTCQKCSLDGPLPDLCFWCWFEIQHGCQGP